MENKEATKVLLLLLETMKVNKISKEDSMKGCGAFFMMCLENDGASAEEIKLILDNLYDQFLINKARNG